MPVEQPFKNPDLVDVKLRIGAKPCEPDLGDIIAAKYRIEAVLGSGGWGKVYRARHLHLDEDVAIKFPDVRLLADIEHIKRFQQEAKACNKLAHPNLVGVSDHGVTGDGVPYIVMEYVEGETLHSLLAASHPFTVEQILQFTMNLADGLTTAHAAGFIHRDIKPGNIVIAKESGTPKLLDFGLVKSADADLTKTGHILGSPAYMSPEQFTGEDIDVRSDVYSLGCVLYESLTGINPFLGSSDMECLYKHLHCDPQSVSLARGSKPTPAGLDHVVARAVAADRAQRYASMQALKDDLLKVLNGLQVEKFRTKRGVKKKELVKGLSYVSALAGMIIVVCGIVVFAPTVLQSRDSWRSNFESAQSKIASGDRKLGVELLRRSRKLAVEAKVPDNQLAAVRLELAGQDLIDGNDEEALAIADHLAIQNLSADDHISTLLLSGKAQAKFGMIDAAAQNLQKAVNLAEVEAKKGNDQPLFKALQEASSTYEAAGMYKAAANALSQWLQMKEKTSSGATLAAAATRWHLGELQEKAADRVAAGKSYKTANQIAQALSGAGEEARNLAQRYKLALMKMEKGKDKFEDKTSLNGR